MRQESARESVGIKKKQRDVGGMGEPQDNSRRIAHKEGRFDASKKEWSYKWRRNAQKEFDWATQHTRIHRSRKLF